MTAGVFDKGQKSEMASWVSSAHSLLLVDSKPTMDTAMQFHSNLLGEMEQLASQSPVRKGVVASSPSGGTGLTPNPKAKSLQAQGQDPNENTGFQACLRKKLGAALLRIANQQNATDLRRNPSRKSDTNLSRVACGASKHQRPRADT